MVLGWQPSLGEEVEVSGAGGHRWLGEAGLAGMTPGIFPAMSMRVATSKISGLCCELGPLFAKAPLSETPKTLGCGQRCAFMIRAGQTGKVDVWLALFRGVSTIASLVALLLCFIKPIVDFCKDVELYFGWKVGQADELRHTHWEPKVAGRGEFSCLVVCTC